MRKKSKVKPINGRDLAKRLGTSCKVVGGLLSSGAIKAVRQNKVWQVNPQSYSAFMLNNRKKLQRLSQQYVQMYWQGLSVQDIQRRVKNDFATKQIFYPTKGFAEKVIHNYLTGKNILTE